jgi:hypothetical protein
MEIKWTKDLPEKLFSSMTGIDEEGNVYHMTAKLNQCICETVDGRKGVGVRPQDALDHAMQREVKK